MGLLGTLKLNFKDARIGGLMRERDEFIQTLATDTIPDTIKAEILELNIKLIDLKIKLIQAL